MSCSCSCSCSSRLTTSVQQSAPGAGAAPKAQNMDEADVASAEVLAGIYSRNAPVQGLVWVSQSRSSAGNDSALDSAVIQPLPRTPKGENQRTVSLSAGDKQVPALVQALSSQVIAGAGAGAGATVSAKKTDPVEKRNQSYLTIPQTSRRLAVPGAVSADEEELSSKVLGTLLQFTKAKDP